MANGQSSRRAWWLCIAAITAFRLALCAQDEIVALNKDPINYARQAAFYLTGKPQDVLPDQRPGIAMLARVSSSVGVPYKLFLDGLFLAAACLAAWSMYRVTRSCALGLSTYALLALNPWFISASQVFLSEPATAVLLLLLVCSSAYLVWIPPGLWTVLRILPAGFVSAACILVRPENPIIYGYWVCVAVAAAWCHRNKFAAMALTRRRRCMAILLLPPVLVLGTTALWIQIHRVHFGIAALSKTDAPQERALLNALYAIRPEQVIRFAPVTRQTMELACRHSATLDKYRSRLVDPAGEYYRIAEQNLGLSGEVGTWLNWHLIMAFGGVYTQSVREMSLAAQEIRQALDDGRLPRRRALYPIDPAWRQWLRDVPAEFCRSAGFSLKPRLHLPMRPDPLRREDVSAVDEGMFDDGLLRRQGTRGRPDLRLSGYCLERTSQFQFVRVLTSSSHVLGTAPVEPGGARGIKFNLTVLDTDLRPRDTVSVEFLPGAAPAPGTPYVVPLSAQWTHLTVSHLATDNPDAPEAEKWTTLGSVTPPLRGWRARWQHAISVYYLGGLGVVVAGSFCLGLRRRLSPRIARRIAALLFIGWGLLLGRSLFYAIVAAWLRWALPRYSAPNNILLVVWLVLSAFAFGAWFMKRIGPIRPFTRDPAGTLAQS